MDSEMQRLMKLVSICAIEKQEEELGNQRCCCLKESESGGVVIRFEPGLRPRTIEERDGVAMNLVIIQK